MCSFTMYQSKHYHVHAIVYYYETVPGLLDQSLTKFTKMAGATSQSAKQMELTNTFRNLATTTAKTAATTTATHAYYSA